KQSCLKCHAHQGYKEGDVRGGFGVSVPAAPFFAAAHTAIIQHAIGLGLIWLLGLAGMAFGLRHVRERVHERDRAEDALREKTMMLDNILWSARDVAIATTDLDYRITYYNPVAAKLFGYTAAEVVGKTVMEIHMKENVSPERLERAVEIVRRDGEYRYSVTQETDDGVRELDSTVAGIFNPDGEMVGYSLFTYDITKRKQAEEEREELQAQLRQSQKMEAVGQLAGGVAHDFNNLLQAILGYGDMALDAAGPDSPVRVSLDEMLKAGHRAKTLVRQLLAFSRRQVLEMDDVNLNDVVADLMKMIRRVIGEHITLDILAAHNLGIVRADPGQIEQILMNLCVNARDAMPTGGTITIETENVRIDEAFCETHTWAKPGRYVLVSVTDTGCGMDDGTRDKVFEPFFTTKDVGEGTGLGLSTVYGLVKQHQGMVHVYSEVGKGTTFKIYLPLSERSAATVGDKIEGPVPGGTETILLAEDDEMVRELTHAFLKRAGYTVLTGAGGEEALRVFEEHADEIDLALLDAIMPRLGGYAVFERIRIARPDIRVLFSSGYSMNAIHTNFVLDEGLALIQKPYQRDDLLRRVREALDDERAAREE
ncbi:MAG: response regulator, partial [Nitrospiraceae bacterium]|nr:response regulator [Nitrospiraceae bacterium]